MKESQYFSPSVAESYTAEKTFLQAFQHYSFGNSRETTIRCALAAVWEAARRHQAELEAEEQEYQRKLEEAERKQQLLKFEEVMV